MGVKIDGNKAANGGGIYNTGTLNTMYYAVEISNNIAAANGGGVYTANGTVNLLATTTIEKNEAAKKGGGIYTANYVGFGSSAVKDCEAKNGGGIYAASGAWVEVVGGKVENCKAKLGGGVYTENGGTVTFSRGNAPLVNGCSAIGSGGGIFSKGAHC